MAIRLQNVSRTYAAASGNALVRALDDVSLHVRQGEWLAIMGPSGSGKSTLVNLMGCLDAPTSGDIWLRGQRVNSATGSQLDRLRAETVGFVFQQFHLIPYLTALENVMLAQYFHSMVDEAQARRALERVGLGERATHLPSRLSGGEQQRVCVARALINDPAILLADEPTGNLDAANQEIVLRLLRELHGEGRTIVMVTHDPVVARMADRRLDLHHGRIVAEENFSPADEEQFDEVLEEMWVRMEQGQTADLAAMQAGGALPLRLAVDKMASLDLLMLAPHQAGEAPASQVINACHQQVHPSSREAGQDGVVLHFTARGRRRAEDVIRRHRLAERLFVETLHMQDEAEIEQQACKFEHILSPEATDRICAFLGHPKTCPHGSPIPAGRCCVTSRAAGR